MVVITIIATVGIAVIGYITYRLHKKSKCLEAELKKATFSLRSAYVRFGKSFEEFVPFCKDFPGDKEKTKFLGMPIDYICFDEDSIKFIEVKTGSSSLSNKQKKIKKMIEDGKVEFCEVRY